MPGISKVNREVLSSAGFMNVTQRGTTETWVKEGANGNVHIGYTCRPAGKRLGWVEIRKDVTEDTGEGLVETMETKEVKDLSQEFAPPDA